MTEQTDSKPPSPWHLQSEEEVADCKVFQVHRRRMRRSSADGLTADFFVLRSPDWVNVVALTDTDDLVLIEQWRHGVEEITLEIPGGMVDPGETPHEAAARELEEETGYTSEKWRYLGHVQPNPAIQANRCHTFLALRARRTASPAFDGTEECRLVLRPYRLAADLVSGGSIRHALVVAGLHWEALRRSGALADRAPETPDL